MVVSHLFSTFLCRWWLIRLQGQIPVLWIRSCLAIYPLIRPPRRLLALDRGEFLSRGSVGHLLHASTMTLPSPSLRTRSEDIINHKSLVHFRDLKQICIIFCWITTVSRDCRRGSFIWKATLLSVINTMSDPLLKIVQGRTWTKPLFCRGGSFIWKGTF